MRKLWLWIAGLVILVIIAVNLYSLEQYPMPHCDEVIYANVSHNFYTQGRFSVSWVGSFRNWDQTHVPSGRLYHIGQGLLLFFGNNLANARLFSVIGWLAAALTLYFVGVRLYDRTTAVLGALLLAVSLNTLYMSHIGRGESWVSFAIAAAILGALRIREHPSSASFFLFGILAGILGIGFHPYAVWVIGPVMIWLLWGQMRTSRGRVRLLWAFTGSLLGGGGMLSAQFLPNPGIAIAQLREMSTILPWTGNFFARLVGQWQFMQQAFVDNLNRAVLVFTIFALGSIGVALWKGTSSDRFLVGVLGISLLVFAFATAHKYNVSFPLWDPILALLIASAAVRTASYLSTSVLQGHPGRFSKTTLAVLLVAPLIIINLAAWAYLSIKFHPRDYQAYLARVQQSVPPGSTVMGDMTLGYAFDGRNRFVSDYVITHFDRESILGTLSDEHIDYVIADGSAGCSTVVSPSDRQFTEVIADHCTEISSFTDPWVGAYGNDIQGRPTITYDCRALPTP